MKLSVLVDNNTLMHENYFGEHGLSFFIEDGDNKVLFDTGYSDIFIKNAQRLGINLGAVNTIVLSHGHLDHTWGLSHLINQFIKDKAESSEKINLITHPFSLNSKNDEAEPIGINTSQNDLNKYFNVELSKTPVWISQKLVYLGQIERINEFENKNPLGTTTVNGIEKEDYLLDDSALCYKSKKGLVIITGCSHSGICNIIEYAKKVCKEERVGNIIGGFHLIKPSEEQLNFTLEYLKKLKPNTVNACHCTDLHSKIALAKAVKLGEVGVGLILEFE